MRKASVTSVRGFVAIRTWIFAAASKLVALRNHCARRSAPSLKAHLAAAPLEGIDLERAHDRGREVDL